MLLDAVRTIRSLEGSFEELRNDGAAGCQWKVYWQCVPILVEMSRDAHLASVVARSTSVLLT